MAAENPHPRIKCATCNASLVIVPASLIDTICCSECGEEIPVESYANLSRLKAQVIADRRDALQRMADAEAMAAEARRQAIDDERMEKEAIREREKAEQLQREEAAASRRIQEAEEVYQRAQAEKLERARIRLATRRDEYRQFDLSATVGYRASRVATWLGLIGVLINVCLAVSNEVLVMTGKVTIPSNGLGRGLSASFLLLLFGLLWHSLLRAADVIISKLDLLLTAYRPQDGGSRNDQQRDPDRPVE